MRPCIEPGCPALTQRTRCPHHTRQREKQRGSPTQRGLDYRYQQTRTRVLAAANGQCYSPGCATPATTADHIVPRSEGGSNDDGNLRASCTRHNSGRRAHG